MSLKQYFMKIGIIKNSRSHWQYERGKQCYDPDKHGDYDNYIRELVDWIKL